VAVAPVIILSHSLEEMEEVVMDGTNQVKDLPEQQILEVVVEQHLGVLAELVVMAEQE
jgi:hypothetical protein